MFQLAVASVGYGYTRLPNMLFVTWDKSCLWEMDAMDQLRRRCLKPLYAIFLDAWETVKRED